MRPTIQPSPAGIHNVATRRIALWGTFLALTFAAVVADAITLTAVQSRKSHGANVYNLTIDTSQNIGGAVTVESRAIGTGHQIVFQFDVPVSTVGVPSAFDETGATIGTLTPLIAGNDVVVTLTNVPDKKRITVMLPGVNGMDVFASMGFLVGDVNNSRTVSATDVSQVKAHAGHVADATNFWFDLNATGVISAADISAVKGRSSQALPAVTSLPTYTLNVSKTGSGSGTVTSSSAGINCGVDCTENYIATTIVTLTAAPATGSTFSGWGGACTGTGACNVTMVSAKSVTANFNPTVIVLPPDPSTVATPNDPTVATEILSATSFLYTGTNPIQTGVSPGAIVAQRVAVLRGKVQTRAGAALAGVTITILAHPELGQTVTRADGMFDVAVDGGGQLTVNYQKAGFLPVQRAIVAPWRDYAWLPDVVMIPLDTAVTTIDLTVTSMQTARGSAVSDADGARQATILFPAGTTATLVLANGSTQPLTTLNVRASEFTIGANGPKAMPAPLPPSSAYTYAAEFSVDEAIAAGATEVRFNQPVPVYVENFLGFPVGSVVPSGYYDRLKGQWIASENGRVIKILGNTGVMADLDTDGDAAIDDATKLTALNITDAERTRLAQLYTAGQTLWRVPVAHFSSWDFNWPFGPPADAGPPPGQDPPPDVDSPNEQCGSVIGCENQSLGESLAVTGTPWNLNYRSERTPDRKDAYQIVIRLSGATLPASVKRIELEVSVAGQRFVTSFAPSANLFYTYTYDGKDAYGRAMQGRQAITVRAGYTYAGVYMVPSRLSAIIDATSLFGHSSYLGSPASANAQRLEVTLWKEFSTRIGSWDNRSAGLGGWSLDNHHAYDPQSQILLLGSGAQRSASALPMVINTVAGNGTGGAGGDGGPATAATLSTPRGVAVGPDGTLYIADPVTYRVRRVAPDGTISTFAGTNLQGFSGDGGPATAAMLSTPNELAVGPDGSVFIVDTENQRVRRVAPDGIITTVAGNGVQGFSGDGGLAVAASLKHPVDVAVALDGSLYIADQQNGRIRRVGPDGIISTFAGNGNPGFGGTGGPATAATLNVPQGVAVGPDGTVYFVDFSSFRIRSVGADGIVHAVAGGGAFRGAAADGRPATDADLSYMYGIAAGPDGSLYVAEAAGLNRIRRVSPEGIITTVAGNGQGGFSGDGGPATGATMPYPYDVTVAPDNTTLYLTDDSSRVRRVKFAFPAFSLTDNLLPAKDGSELYAFNAAGRHLQTIDTLTGALRYQFAYSVGGYLNSVTDGSGNVTTVERSGAIASAVVAPGGQRTTLTVGGGGWLLSAANPASQAHTMTYSTNGLLQTFTDPRSKLHQFTYDALGRLTRDDNPALGSTTLARTEQSNGYTVTTTSALGRTHSYQVELLATGATRRTVAAASGKKTIMVINTDSSEQTTYADGSSRTVTFGPDPRWGALAPIAKSVTVNTPGGRSRIVTTARTVTLSDPANLLSLTNQTDTVTDNGAVSTRVYSRSGATRTVTDTSAAGRGNTVSLDALGRVIQVQTLGLDPVAYTYEGHGLISTISEGSGGSARTTTLTYDASLQLTGATDALGRSMGLTYDSAGRLVTATLPGARTVTLAYDASGNLTALTPPGKTAHAFGYTNIDETASYTPPDLGSGSTATLYTYDTDRALTHVTRPDGQMIDVAYDAAGRPASVTIARGAIGYSYSPTTDQLTGITAPGGLGLAYSRDSELLTGVTWSGAVAGATAYTYNNDLRVTTETVNGGSSVNFTYAADGLLTGAGSLALTRNAQNGLLTGSTLGNVTENHSYNTLAERSNTTASYNATAIYNAAYTRDAGGRIAQIVETIGGTTTTFGYGYDAAGRLNAVSKDAVPVSSYSYDLNGNRIARTGPTLSATYDAQDRLISNGTTSYSYTANGELLSKVSGAQITSYHYDALGNLLQVTLPNATVIDYLIDGTNRRIGKKLNGTLVQGFLYQGAMRPVAELDGSNAVVSRFVYGTRINVPDYLIKGGVTYRIITDHLGSPRLVVDVATGNVAQRLDYDEFGHVLTDSSPGFQPFGFAGGLYDKDTKLVRFGARDYDAETGRWTAKDPIAFAGRDTNMYAYVGNDPANAIDVDGLCPVMPGGTLYSRVHDLRLQWQPNVTGNHTRGNLPPGTPVTFLGFTPSNDPNSTTRFVMVLATMSNGTTVVGFTLQSNLSTNPVPVTVDSASGSPFPAQSFASSGAATKG